MLIGGVLECNAGSGQAHNVLERFRFGASSVEEIHVGGRRSKFRASSMNSSVLSSLNSFLSFPSCLPTSCVVFLKLKSPL